MYDKRRVITIIGLILIVIALPLTVFFVRQQQELRSRATFTAQAAFIDTQGNVITETTDPTVHLRITRQLAQTTPTQPTPTPTPITGFGKAIKNSTTSTGYVTAPSYTGFQAVGGLVVAVWIKPSIESLAGTNPFVILGKEFASGEASGYSLSLVNKKIEFKIAQKTSTNATPTYTLIRSTSELQSNSWYYISIVTIPVGGVSELHLNINGVSEAAQGIGSVYDPVDKQLVIGCGKPINFSCLNHFYGEIDDVLISQIGANPNPPTAPVIPRDRTLALYHLDGDGKDSSGHGLDGQVVGNVQFVNSTAGACTSTLDTFQGVDRCSGQFETPKYRAYNFTCKSGYSSTRQVTGYPGCLYESELQYLAKAICETASPEHCSSASTAQNQTLSADINGDGVIDTKDRDLIVSQYGQGGANLPADLDKNGVVDIYDYNSFLEHYGN